jgi:AraC family transcriptional regulator, regulatory protein of adaptative response / DNA-3-methyladenine glycosylase II
MAMTPLSAVVTTGIYCRPDCSARPNASNVRPFATAAAAEAAGFRACLRCRPYRTAPVPTWVGPELICRAVQLVLDGVLDDGTEEALGRRVGVSARHLRRLFLDHLGVTPDQLARSRRAHFARRLLDDSDLSVAEVAFAAGFGSVRQFNRAMLDTFRAAPVDLRAKRRQADRLVADGGLAIRLPFTAPYDWNGVRAYLSGRAIAGVERVDGEVYRRTIEVNGDPGVLEVRPGGPDHLVLTAHLPHWEGLIHIVQRVRRILGLDVDPAEVASALGNDSILGARITSQPGLRMPGTWDPFEIGVRAIIGQQVSVAGANTITGRLVARFGRPVAGLGEMGLSSLFPTADRLAANDADFTGLGLTTARITAITSFAQAVVNDDIRFDRSVALADFVDSVVAVRGLGPWTAHYLALRLGEPDAFPSTDLGLKRGAERLLGTSVSYPELGRLSEQWRPLRSMAALHLWLADSAA